jgi:hypothetical protein
MARRRAANKANLKRFQDKVQVVQQTVDQVHINQFRKSMMEVLRTYLPWYVTQINQLIEDPHVIILRNMLRTGQENTKSGKREQNLSFMIEKASYWILDYVVDYKIDQKNGSILNKAGLATSKTQPPVGGNRRNHNLGKYKRAMYNALSQVNW